MCHMWSFHCGAVGWGSSAATAVAQVAEAAGIPSLAWELSYVMGLAKNGVGGRMCRVRIPIAIVFIVLDLFL